VHILGHLGHGLGDPDPHVRDRVAGEPLDARNAHEGPWIVNLGGRGASRSKKNCIMSDGADTEVSVATKLKSDTLVLDGLSQISAVQIFTFNPARFMCPL